MTRDQANAMWHARWTGLHSSGLTMKDFAQREGFYAPSAYRWLRKARRCGLWPDEPKPGKAIAVTKPRAAAVFARVAVNDAVRSSMLLRLVLANGRRAELEIAGAGELAEVIDVLERRA
jgi:transposase-like protein